MGFSLVEILDAIKTLTRKAGIAQASGRLASRLKTGYVPNMLDLLDARNIHYLFKNYGIDIILREMARFWLEELRQSQSFPICPAWSGKIWRGLEKVYGIDCARIRRG